MYWLPKLRDASSVVGEAVLDGEDLKGFLQSMRHLAVTSLIPGLPMQLNDTDKTNLNNAISAADRLVQSLEVLSAADDPQLARLASQARTATSHLHHAIKMLVPVLTVPHDLIVAMIAHEDSVEVPGIEDVLSSPATSYWLRDTLASALDRDPVKAANDAGLLSQLLTIRADALLHRAKAEIARQTRITN
jgi:hypothetical protein